MRYRRDDFARAYRREHPLALCLTAGIALSGIVALLDPSSVEQSSVSLALPRWLLTFFYVSYAFGGLVSFVGLMSPNRSLEAAGMALLASSLTAQWASVVYLTLEAGASFPIQSTFILTLALGCGLRAYRR